MHINRIFLYTCFSRGLIFTLLLSLFYTASVSGEPMKEPPVLDGISAWFPLDSKSGDIGPNNLLYTVNGSVSVPDKAGKSGGAMHFDGKDDYIYLGLDINPSKMPRMSVAMWVKPEQQWGALLTNDDGNWDRSVTLENRPEIKGVSILAGDGGQWFGGINIPMNEWRLVIATYDAGKRRASLYVKNQQIEKRICTNANPGKGFNYTLLGKSPFPDPANAYHFKGSIDNVLIWDRVLSEKEISDILESPQMLDSGPRMEIFSALDDAREMFRAGFYEQGTEKYCDALERAGVKIRSLLRTSKILDEKMGIPPRFLGEIFLSHYRALLNQKMAPRMGFTLKDTESGVLVDYLFKDLAACKAGLRVNDIIREIDSILVKNKNDITEYLKGRSPGDLVTVSVQSSGTDKKIGFKLEQGLDKPLGTAYAVLAMLDYGMLAAYTGHPSLVMQAAMEIRKVMVKYPADVKTYFTEEAAVILEALAAAMEQGAGPAYKRLLEHGKFRAHGAQITKYKDYFYPLYEDAKKLAYFLDRKDVSSLKLPENMNTKKQEYINLRGVVVEPGGNIPVLNSPGNAGTGTPKSSVKGTVLD